MNPPPEDSDDSEYRPTDWLAVSGFTYGYGRIEDVAIQGVLRYAGPWDEDRDDPVSVATWKLYADSWQSHDPTGPERGAEQLAFYEREIPVEEANEVHEKASLTRRALDRALESAEVVQEEGRPDED